MTTKSATQQLIDEIKRDVEIKNLISGTKMGRLMRRIKTYIIPVAILFLGQWICTRPNIMKPFSPYSSYDWGYRSATGKYPDTCPSTNCRIHHKGFWVEFFSK